jgi:2-oxoglutarate dehydrogenase E1 component
LALSSYPEDFQVHPFLKRILKAKRKMVETGEDVDWSLAEALV